MISFTGKAAIAGTLLAAGIGVSAAAEDNAHIANCRQAESPQARIDCLEYAIRKLSGEVRVNSTKTRVSSISAAGLTQTSAEEISAAGHAEVESSDPVSPDTAQKSASSEPDGTVVATTAAIAVIGTIADIASPNSTPDKFETLGEEQVATHDTRNNGASTSRLVARVVAFDFVGRDKLLVTLENGQVWRQNNSDRPNLYRDLRNKEHFDVELWKSSRAGYRMRIPDANRTIRVKRLK